MNITLPNGVCIRPFVDEDADSIPRYADNRKIAENLRDAFPNPYTIEDAREWISIAQDSLPLAHFALEYNKECIGGIGLTLFDDIFSHAAELGYWIGEPFWGRGIITDCIEPVLRYGFTELDLERIFAITYTSNIGSIRVLEKNNFTYEGTFRKGAQKNGVYHDVVQYAILKEDFNL